jgi:hypothetical protein
MKYEIIVGAHKYYMKLYLANPSTQLFEAQFYFWKILKNTLTNVLGYTSIYELQKILSEETRIKKC